MKAKPPKTPTTQRYGPGTIRPAPNGRGYDCTVIHLRRRHRCRLPDLPSARAWIDATEASALHSAPALTRAQLLDAAAALHILPPGATLHAAATHYLTTAQPPTLPPLSHCIRLFLTDRLTHHIRPTTHTYYRQTLNRLLAHTGDLPASAITPHHLTTLLSPMPPTSHNTHLRRLKAFFNHLTLHHPNLSNPATHLRPVRQPQPNRGILTLEQVSQLLATAQTTDPRFIPYLVLGLFAGIRPAELTRLHPDQIGTHWITITGATAKTLSHRTIPIRPNLRAWLDLYPPSYPITPLSQHHHYAALRRLRAPHSIPWPPDCLRHSYASYAYDLTRDAPRIASELGHQGTAIFYRHYRGLVPPGSGAKFFAILPTLCQRHA